MNSTRVSPSLTAMAFECLPFSAFAIAPDMRVLAWNKNMETLSSMTSADCIGKTLDTLRDKQTGKDEADALGVFKARLKKCAAQKPGAVTFASLGEPVSMKLGCQPDKSCLMYTSPLFDAQGAFEGMLCLLLDCLPQRREDAADDFYKRLLMLSPGMAYQILNDGKWTIRYVSEGCEELTGYDQKYFCGKTFSALANLLHKDDETKALSEFYTSIANNHPFAQEFRIRDASGGEKWILHRGRAVFSDGQELLSVEGYLRDMSPYKKKEQRLQSERKLLRSALRDRKSFGSILGQSPAMHKVYDLIISAALSENSVFISGETGTGKELVARAIHDNSDRCKAPFVALNCGAIPENLIEAEFFGYKKGAFTGATQDKPGYIECATGGTLFLDEIGEISLGMQVKLLRALEVNGFTPVGGNTVIRPDVRIIAASNKNLRELVETGVMRRDFFYRIYVIPIQLPPLRERGDDVILLANHFLAACGNPEHPLSLAKAESALLKSYSWPGNVRELQNAIRRYLTLGDLDFIREHMQHDKTISEDGDFALPDDETLDMKNIVEKVERKLILTALNDAKWHKINAAFRLGISRRTLFRKIKDLGIADIE